VLADFWYFIVNQHITFFDDLFDMRAGNVYAALRQKNIQPLPDLAFIYRKAYFFRLFDQVIVPIFVITQLDWVIQDSFSPLS
jgi:hypothetical protein